MELKGPYEKFCRAYVYETNENATAAARLAGYSEKSSYKQGWRLSNNVQVRERVRELRLEALRESGYDKDKVKRLVAGRLVSIVATKVTDIVHISPGPDDPKRQEVLDSIAALNNGQRYLDFGDVLIAPTLNLSPEAQEAIKSIKINYSSKGGYISPEIELYDVVQAARALAQIFDIGGGDANVNINLDVADRLDSARRRVAEQARAGGAGRTEEQGNGIPDSRPD